MSATVKLIHEADMDHALRKYYRRRRDEAATVDMPFDDILKQEDELEGEVGRYEINQRLAGIRGLLAFLTSKGLHPAAVLKQLYAAGRGFGQEPFCSLTMGEAALMFGETKAAVSWRCKVLSGKIELAGMKGSRLPGQKRPETRETYSAAQRGNCNRRGNPAKRCRSKRRHVSTQALKP